MLRQEVGAAQSRDVLRRDLVIVSMFADRRLKLAGCRATYHESADDELLRRHQRLLVHGVEGQFLSREDAGQADAGLLRRAVPHGRDQQHLSTACPRRRSWKRGPGRCPPISASCSRPRSEITHIKRLKDAASWCRRCSKPPATLKKRLGPLLFQLPPNFKKDVPRLREFLALLSRDAARRWSSATRRGSTTRSSGCSASTEAALCIADAEDDLEVPFVATADWGYLRLRRPDYTTRRSRSGSTRMQGTGLERLLRVLQARGRGQGAADGRAPAGTARDGVTSAMRLTHARGSPAPPGMRSPRRSTGRSASGRTTPRFPCRT